MARLIANGIHNGEVTHHQDQLETTPISANFKIRNTIKTRLQSPTPPPLFCLFELIV